MERGIGIEESKDIGREGEGEGDRIRRRGWVNLP